MKDVSYQFTIPKTHSDITLNQFIQHQQALVQLMKDGYDNYNLEKFKIKILSIYLQEDYDKIVLIPLKVLDEIIKDIDWVFKPIITEDFEQIVNNKLNNPVFEFNNQKYKAIGFDDIETPILAKIDEEKYSDNLVLKKLKQKENWSLQTATDLEKLEIDLFDLQQMPYRMVIACRPLNTDDTLQAYDLAYSNSIPTRAQQFLNMPLDLAFALHRFFLHRSENYLTYTVDSISQVQSLADLIQKEFDSLETTVHSELASRYAKNLQ